MEKLNDLKSLVDALAADVDLFYTKDNKAAARRSRKVLQEIGKLTKEFRKEISERVNALKVQ